MALIAPLGGSLVSTARAQEADVSVTETSASTETSVSEDPVSAPELSTDKADYAPGETVTIFGRFFSALQDIVLTIIGGTAEAGDYVETTVTAVTDDLGSFSIAHVLEEVFRPLYTVIARSTSGETLATTTFTDATPTSFTQCANDNPTAGDCDWIGSIIQQSNSVYYEGMTVPQRLLFRDVASNGTHTVSFTYQYTKAGIHAYDFLTTVNPNSGGAQGNGSFVPGTPVLNPCADLTGPDLTACTALNPAGTSPILVAVPTDTFDSKDSAPGVGTGSTQAAKEASYATANGPRNIAVYATSGAFTSPSITLAHAGGADSDTGDSDVTVTLTFTSSGCSASNKCKFLLYFGGHLAVTGADNTSDSNWGPGFGSSQISGGPYHMKSVKFDGTGGSQDNQIKGADILSLPPQGSLSGVKFDDANGDGIKDPNELPIAGWTVTLSGDASGTTTTDANGIYTFSDLADGTYTVCEGTQSGWTQTYPATGTACGNGTTGYTLVLSGGASLSGNDFGNTQSGTVVIDKVTLPSGDPQSFGFTLAGPTAGAASLADADAPAVLGGRVAGTYTLTESSVAGWTLTGASCDAASTPVSGGLSFALAAGQTVTCTFTNTKDAKLTVIKNVVNDDGGTLAAGAFPLLIDGNPTPSGRAQVVATGSHTVSETQQTGYAQTSIGGDCDANGGVSLNPGDEKTCIITNDDIQPTITLIKNVTNDNGGTLGVSDFPLNVSGTPVTSGTANGMSAGSYVAGEAQQFGYAASAWGGDCAADGSVTLAVGENKTCTITNDDVQPTLTLVKTVTNDNGGTLQVSDFPLNVSGTPVTSGAANGMNAGSYQAGETQQFGYAASAWGGDCAADGSVTLSVGDAKTCTITNDDIQPTLTLVKNVTNDDGGTLGVSDFPLNVSGSPVTSGQSNAMNAGAYTAGETNQFGYAASAWGGDCAADGSVTLAVGENKTCVITNDDIQPTITLIKNVTNDNGGTLGVSDFPLNVSGTPVTSGTANGMSAGSYVAGETQQFGYAASAWGGDCDSQGNVSLSVGENKTCTITNDDIRPTLTLIKNVTNDDGGTLGVSDFTLDISGTPTISGSAMGLSAGSYQAGEQSAFGYSASAWSGDCAADGSVSLSVGENKTCSITNDDIRPTLTLVKTVINDDGGTLQVADFSLNVSGSPVTSGAVNGMNAGSYQAGETQQFGYAASAWGGDCAADGSVTLAVGENKTCSITNDDIQPTLTLVKTVVNDNGGTLQVADFSLNVSGSPVTSGAVNGMNAGSYQAGETQQFGYAASAWGGDCAADGSVTLAAGENKTCSITNDDVPAEIHGMKFEDTNGNGLKDVGEPGLQGWTINLAGTAAASTATDADGNYAFTNLSVGTYSVTETQQAGWLQTTADPAPVTLGLGDVANGLDFGNFKLIDLSGHKWHDLDGDGLQGSGEENLAGWTFYVDVNGNNAFDLGEPSAVSGTNGNYVITGVGPGTWSVCEAMQSGWQQTFPVNGACHTGNASSGTNVGSLDFGNVNEHEGTIGLWRNWFRHNKYTQTEIDGWLTTIDGTSAWLMTESGYAANTTGMVALINDATKYCSQQPDKIECAKRKFLAQYMVNRLNVLSGRKTLGSTYNLSSFGAAMSYLGISPSTSVTLGTYFAKVELKAASSPNRNQFLQMASVSDHINNIGL